MFSIGPEKKGDRRNVELMWLLGRLVPDHKTVADFRKDNGRAIRKVCARFVELCREVGLLVNESIAIDGSKFKAVNNRDRNLTRAKVERRRAQLEESVARYLSQLDTADRYEPTEALATKTEHLKEKLTKLTEEMAKLATLEVPDAGLVGSAGVPHRPRQSIHGNQWPRLRRRWLQCAGRGGYRASPDCRP